MSVRRRTMSYETLLVEEKDGVATVLLNRPERLNAYTPQMGEELLDFFRRADDDEDIRVVVMTGAGKAFCAGADVTGFADDVEARKSGDDTSEGRSSTDRVIREHEFINAMRNFTKPFIASINGPAVGLGCSMPLMADIRLASEDAKIGAIFARVGLIPEFGSTYTLPRIVGLPKACELVFTGKIIDAREALDIGLVNQIYPAETLREETQKMAVNIAEMAPLAVRFAKKGFYQGMENTFKNQLQFESFGLDYLFKSRDHEEGVKAFLEKRKPKFEGR
jgi:2-(1,2-epoxy-1,2-dihydrophenyl)acetyl-CoA isomerase